LLEGVAGATNLGAEVRNNAVGALIAIANDPNTSSAVKLELVDTLKNAALDPSLSVENRSGALNFLAGVAADPNAPADVKAGLIDTFQRAALDSSLPASETGVAAQALADIYADPNVSEEAKAGMVNALIAAANSGDSTSAEKILAIQALKAVGSEMGHIAFENSGIEGTLINLAQNEELDYSVRQEAALTLRDVICRSTDGTGWADWYPEEKGYWLVSQINGTDPTGREIGELIFQFLPPDEQASVIQGLDNPQHITDLGDTNFEYQTQLFQLLGHDQQLELLVQLGQTPEGILAAGHILNNLTPAERNSLLADLGVTP